MSWMDEEEEPRPTALQRVRVALWAILGLLVAGGIVTMIVTVLGHGSDQRHTITTVTRILLPPPPPPPPPPPKPKEPPPPEKQVEKVEEPKPVKEPPKPKEAPTRTRR
jgi:outer membrane biosynthesis protein TonB